MWRKTEECIIFHIFWLKNTALISEAPPAEIGHFQKYSSVQELGICQGKTEKTTHLWKKTYILENSANSYYSYCQNKCLQVAYLVSSAPHDKIQ